MLYKPNEGENVYEVFLYNKFVRSLVKENQSHLFFGDRWADRQKHDVVACNEFEARRMVAEHFRADDGFVIEGVVLTAF